MKNLNMTERMFSDVRKNLAQSTQVDAVRCFAAVQAHVAKHLSSLRVDESLIRLAKSDLAETLLSKEALRIAEAPVYRLPMRPPERLQVLELALTGFLFDWVTARASSARQRELIDACARRFVEQLLTGTPGQNH